ncbi:MAG: glutathione peroxidase [Acidobacteriaceae bacterium]
MPVATSLYDLPVQRINGEATSLADFRGQVLLIVNVASRCGLTAQYSGLEKLFQTYKARGFNLLAFPANDFAGQEPGSNQEIQNFCSTSYSVTFPLFSKIPVTGPNAHPLYQLLTEAQPTAQINDAGFRANLDSFLATTGPGIVTNPEPGILWNFEKFLVDRNGEVIARFAPDMLPDDPRIAAAIEAAL